MADGGQMERNQLLHELQRLMADAQQATDLQALKSIFYRVQTIGQEYQADPTVQRAVTEIKNIVVGRGKALQEGGGTMSTPFTTGGTMPFTTSTSATPVASAPAPVPTPPEMKTPETPVPPPPAPPVSKSAANLGSLRPKPQAPAPPALNWKTPVLVGAGLALALVTGAILFLRQDHAKPPVPPPGTVGILDVRTTPPGAAVLINGKPSGKSNGKLELPAGQYDLQVTLDGYEPAARTIAISPGAPLTLDLPLRPAGNTLRLVADMEGGSVTLDGKAEPLQAGQATMDKVAPGEHTLKVAGRAGEASIQFETPAGAMPRIRSITNVKNFVPIVIANLGGQAHIQSNAAKPVKISIDGKPAGELTADGLDVRDLSMGDHELTWGEGSDQKKLIVRFGPAPSLTVHLKLDLEAGTLVIVTGEDKARVLLNGRPYPILTARGQLRIPNLAVQTYSVSVTKDGYQAVPEQKVQIKKGEESRLQFTMKALPQVSVLRLEGAPTGMTVLLDKESIGTVQTDGFLSHSGIAPGEHTIELRREGHVTKTFRKTFVAGQAIELTGSDVVLEPALGTVKVAVTPPNAQIAYRRSGETQLTPVTGGAVSLPEGTYTIVARAAGFNEQGKSVTVTSGRTSTVELTLTAERTVTTSRPTPMGMNAFEAPASWTKEGEWLVHRGGNFVLTKAPSTPGTLSFTASLLKNTAFMHTRPLQWVVHYQDPKNHIMYKLDKKNIARVVTVNGKSGPETKHPHNLDDVDAVPLMIEITPQKINHYVKVGDKSALLDSYVVPNGDLTEGRFGFYIPGNDEVGLAHFSYLPQ